MSHSHKYLLVFFFLNPKIKSTLPPICQEVRGYRGMINDLVMDTSIVLLFSKFL